MEVVTDKQKYVIGIIATNTGHTFEGTTKDEARQFISTYIDESKRATESHIESSAVNRLKNIGNIEHNIFMVRDYTPFGPVANGVHGCQCSVCRGVSNETICYGDDEL